MSFAAQARAQIEVQRQALARLHNGARPQEVLQAQSAVTAARADAERAAQELQRLQGISAATDGRGVSAQELERAQTAAEVSASALEQQRQRLELIEQGPRSEEIAGAEAQLQAFQAQLDLLQYQIEQGTLTAPVVATVRSRLIEVGDMATPQRAAFTLALTDPKWVRVFASETQLGRIHPGMTVEVVTDSQPDQPIQGSVGFISSVAEFTPKSVQTEELRTSLVYEVRVTVEDPQNRLRLGQPVTVRMAASTAQ